MLSGVFKEELRICPNVANTLRVYHQKISDLLYFHLRPKGERIHFPIARIFYFFTLFLVQMDDAGIDEWDFDYFITIREQTVDWVERMGQGRILFCQQMKVKQI